ncbi:hypothetical protein [Petroclostridium sp. X23]|uniref:hypothetical protein n=1 Tax=Petroclostridium sp. X23 TaxID=3045146 RepID=UPI0024AD7E9C|nr:hypothetical protein [Petroclostridium sp. X23]WHH60952.1 hypothetical protein QKW49_09705 [Petroclostridium sp. X23]
MQDESVKQSLLLWAEYIRQMQESRECQETLKKNIKKVERYLGKAGVTQVKLQSTILNYYTLKYTQDDEDKIIQFDIEELEQASFKNTPDFIENEK